MQRRSRDRWRCASSMEPAASRYGFCALRPGHSRARGARIGRSTVLPRLGPHPILSPSTTHGNARYYNVFIAQVMPDTVAEQVPAILLRAARSVCQVLTGILPALTPSWWDDLVLASLSFQQQRAVEVWSIDALSGLDLAALLRVFDVNWNAIAEHLRLPNEIRHYLKEARTPLCQHR